MIYSLIRPRYTTSLEDCGTSLSLKGPERVVPAVTKEATSDCAPFPLRAPASCQICTRTLEYVSEARLFILLSRTNRTLAMSSTTFSPVSLAWKLQRSAYPSAGYLLEQDGEEPAALLNKRTCQLGKLVYPAGSPSCLWILLRVAVVIALVIRDVAYVYHVGEALVVCVDWDKLGIRPFH